MSDVIHTGRGDLALTILRFAVLATASTLFGVLAHVIWKAATG